MEIAKTRNMLEFYKDHPEEFFIKKHTSKDLYIVSYKHLGIDWSLPYALDARGIVLDGESNVVARPYRKFFNYGELRSRVYLPQEIKDMSEWDEGEDFTVYEKFDGSLVTVFTHGDKLYYASSGSLQGAYPHKFKAWFDKNLTKGQKKELKKVGERYTLLFEYIAPDNRVVVRYNEEDMILHGVIETETGREIDNDKVLEVMAETLGVGRPNIFPDLTYDRLMRLKENSWGENMFEGFVVKFESGKRLKIKTDEYVELHPLYTLGFGELNTKNKVEMILNRVVDGEIDDLIAVFEDKKDQKAIDMVHTIIGLAGEYDELIAELVLIASNPSFDKREFALENDTSSFRSQTVFNIDKPDKLDKLRHKYVQAHLEEALGTESWLDTIKGGR